MNKTKFVIITKKRSFYKDSVNIKINGEKLQRVKEIKYLGIIIDENLNFKSNIDHVCKKIGSKVNLICRLNNKLNCEQKINLYKTLIEPFINYCSTILFLSSDVDIERIQKLQNKVMRNILKMNKFTSQSILLNILKFHSVKQKKIFNTLFSLYKIVNNLWPQYLTKRIV